MIQLKNEGEGESLRTFRELIWEFYREHGRDLPWRHDPAPYQVFVSEIMLQQTQVSRVLERYPRWLRRFPHFEALAKASVAEVLEEWQGMGYNRRALWLRNAAQMVLEEFGGELPRSPAVSAGVVLRAHGLWGGLGQAGAKSEPAE